MTELEKAARQALEALESCEMSNYGRDWVWPATAHETAMKNVKEAITALREALAEQPAQVDPCIDGSCSCCWTHLDEQPAQQQPEYKHCDDGKVILKNPEVLSQRLREQRAQQQEPVIPTAVEMQNAAANLALMREMWGNADEPAAKVNDDGFIVETGLLLSPGMNLYTSPQPAQQQEPVGYTSQSWLAQSTGGQFSKRKGICGDVPLYTSPPASKPWVGLTDEDVYPLANAHLRHQPESYEVSGIYGLVSAIEAKLREKNAQPSKPLTDEQIIEMYNEPRSDAEMLEFARAIEAAHGIKGDA